jgi:hypothetical protein
LIDMNNDGKMDNINNKIQLRGNHLGDNLSLRVRGSNSF